jgi:hypothetical protein
VKPEACRRGAWLHAVLLIGSLVHGAEEKKDAPSPRPPGSAKTQKGKPGASGSGARRPMVEAREGFETKLLDRPDDDSEPAPEPPAGELTLTRYRSPVGDLAAYVSPDPGEDTGKEGRDQTSRVMWRIFPDSTTAARSTGCSDRQPDPPHGLA